MGRESLQAWKEYRLICEFYVSSALMYALTERGVTVVPRLIKNLYKIIKERKFGEVVILECTLEA